VGKPIPDAAKGEPEKGLSLKPDGEGEDTGDEDGSDAGQPDEPAGG